MQGKHTVKLEITLIVAATILGTTHASISKDAKCSIASVVKGNAGSQ